MVKRITILLLIKDRRSNLNGVMVEGIPKKGASKVSCRGGSGIDGEEKLVLNKTSESKSTQNDMDVMLMDN